VATSLPDQRSSTLIGDHQRQSVLGATGTLNHRGVQIL